MPELPHHQPNHISEPVVYQAIPRDPRRKAHRRRGVVLNELGYLRQELHLHLEHGVLSSEENNDPTLPQPIPLSI
ncbi:MAG: hypothetical protein NWE89_12440 [Candidatus Bathyarchaeota archaeon]|nr:hypothetical protein [Candidatus Bathyarchaeota archaeon]